MNLLIINTAGNNVEIALKVGKEARYYTNEKKEMASAVLLCEVERIINELGISLNDIDYFAGVIGPGSFTGIRIGVSTIRAFCQSQKKKAIAVNRLELLAYNSKTDCKYTVSVVDGQNDVCYYSIFSNQLKTKISEPTCIRTSDLKSILDQIDGSLVIVADYDLKIEDYFVINSCSTVESLIGFVEFLIDRGKIIDYTSLEPLYIRKAQAERVAGEL